jgi:hypothetical protein
MPDLFVLHRAIAHMVEIRKPAGELTDPQHSLMAAVLVSGGCVGMVRDAEEMLGPPLCVGRTAGKAPGGACRVVGELAGCVRLAPIGDPSLGIRVFKEINRR